MSRLRCRPRRRRLTLAVLGAIVALVVIGPLLAPHPEDVVVSAPYAAAGDGGSLGTDVLGRDVLSRVLRGGGELLLTAALAAIGGTVLGAVAGLIAAVRRRWLGLLLERVTEIVLVVPSVLILILVGTAISDPSPLVVAAVLALLATPWVARVVVAAAEPVIRAGYVEHAIASGESTWWVITRDVAPNMRATLLTLLGLRFVEAVYLVSAAAFLQVGPQPPEANWALMVRENAQGVLLNPWATAAPSLAIASIAVAVTYACDRHRLREPPL
jgi:peptide/nickel transport system permease protein